MKQVVWEKADLLVKCHQGRCDLPGAYIWIDGDLIIILSHLETKSQNIHMIENYNKGLVF